MSRIQRIVLIATAALVLLIAAVVLRRGWVAADESGSRPVATVGDHSVSVDRFNRSYLQYLMATGRNDTPTFRYAHLDNLVQQMLLADEARRRGLDTTAAFSEHLKRHQLLAAGARYFDREFAESLPPLTETEVRAAFRHANEQVILRHVVFPDRARAEHAARLLAEGEDFVDLANEVFDTPDFDSLAGYLGVAKYWDLDDALADVAYSLNPGEISGAVRSRYGWHVLRVEDRLRSPILSESEFQTRRSGIEGRAVIRRNRIKGDTWVRELMESSNVVVEPEAIRLVTDVLRQHLKPASDEGRSQVLMTREEIQEVRTELEAGTVIAHYDLDDRQTDFLASDFVRWLPELPYDELRDRPVAAVGRALRNEALGRMGLARGWEKDREAQEAITFASDLFLANRLRERLRINERVEPTDDEIREAFDKLNTGRLRSATATYWSIPFPSLPEADEALKAIRAGARPDSYRGYQRIVNGDILDMDGPAYLRQAPLGAAAVHCSEASECRIVQVDERTLERVTLDEKREEIRETLARLLPEERLTNRLFTESGVRVDTLLFRQMMMLR